MTRTPAHKRRAPPGFFDEEFLGNSPSPKKHRCNDPRRPNYKLGSAYFSIFDSSGRKLDTPIHLFELVRGSSPPESTVEAVGGSGGFVDSCFHWDILLSLLGATEADMVDRDYRMRVGETIWSIDHPRAWARAIRELMLLFHECQQPNKFWPAQIGPAVAWDDLRDVQHSPDLYEHWQDTCQFFCHDPVQTAIGVRLPGFRKPLSTIAMVKIFWALHALVTKAHLPLPLTPEEEFAKVGVVALCWSSVDQQLAGEHDARCPGAKAGGQAFGVQCPCHTPSLTYDVWLHTVRAPSIFYVAWKTEVTHVMTLLNNLFSKQPCDEDFTPLISAAGFGDDGLFFDSLISNQPRPLLKEDFLARVSVVGNAQSMIPDSSNLSSLRTQMQVSPLLHASGFTGPDTSHGQERFILVLAGPVALGNLDDAFSARTSVWIPGQSQQHTIMVTRKLYAMTLGYFGPCLHDHDADVLKTLIDDLHQPQHYGRGTIMFAELDEWVKRM